MNISGTTNSHNILGNNQFTKTGDEVSESDTIKITNSKGMEVSDCFGITSNVIDDISKTGDCESILEIKITKGLTNTAECPVAHTEQPSDGLILAEYIDGSTTLNVHPDCCEALGFTSEIGDDGYYVCRWKIILDPTDCSNYIPNSEFDNDGYKVFTFDGNDTNIVPNVNCCYTHNLEESIDGDGIHCVEIPVPICSRYTLIEPVPSFGNASFIDSETSNTVTVVPTSDCCIIGSTPLSFTEVDGGFVCYNAQNPPTVSITLEATCCEPAPFN